METLKHTYYVDISNGEILEAPIDGSPNFRIHANEAEVAELKRCFSENYTDDLKTYARSHVPYLEYHKQSQNDKYEASMKAIYARIHKLGDAEARRFIEKQGILDLDFKDQREDIERLKE